MFLDLDFSFIQIKLSGLMSPTVEPIPDDKETEEEVLVTDRPGGVPDNLVNPQEQIGNPHVDP